MLLTIQPDLVRKDMRHETRLFLYGITMDTPLDELRDGGHGLCPQRVESMVQGIFIPFVVDPPDVPGVCSSHHPDWSGVQRFLLGERVPV